MRENTNELNIDIDDLSTDDIVYLAEQYIHHDRNKRIFLKRYIRGMTYNKIADTELVDYNEIISIDQIKRVLKKYMLKIIKHIEVKNGHLRVVR